MITPRCRMASNVLKPMSFLARRRAEKMFRQGGWGPLLSFPVQRGGLPPLVFQMRLPLTTQLIDLDRLEQEVTEARELVRQSQAATARVGGAAGAILLGALCGGRSDGGVDVLGTLTVEFLEGGGDWAPPEERETNDPQARVGVRVTRLSDAAAQIRQLMLVDLPGHAEPTPMVILQYLVRSRYGPLSMTFGSSHPGMLSVEGHSFFTKIFETGFIGEAPRPF
jgi:hypothetical protein